MISEAAVATVPTKNESGRAQRSPPRLLTVKRKRFNGKGLVNITLTGVDLDTFPEGYEGAHIKIFIPRSHQEEPLLPWFINNKIHWPPVHDKPIVRTFTMRRYCSQSRELDIEFVVHGLAHPASGWALKAKEGDKIGVSNPGGPCPLLVRTRWSILAGDLSAVPAIAALLETLPYDYHGRVFIEVDDISLSIPLKHPANVDICWVERRSGNNSLLQAILDSSIPSHKYVSGFIAGENSAVVDIRNYLVSTHGFSKSNLYAVPYWKRGSNEDGYHAERHTVMDEDY